MIDHLDQVKRDRPYGNLAKVLEQSILQGKADKIDEVLDDYSKFMEKKQKLGKKRQ